MTASSETNSDAQDDLDPYADTPRLTGRTIARFIGRCVGVVVGLGIGLYGMSFYVLRCFSTCPTDPAEDTLSHILPLTIMTLAAAVITAAVTIGTPGVTRTWIMTALGGLVVVGGISGLLVVPSLQSAGERSDIVMFGIISVALGVGFGLLGRWVRSRA